MRRRSLPRGYERTAGRRNSAAAATTVGSRKKLRLRDGGERRRRMREREVGGRDENRKRAHSSPEVEPGRVKAKRLAGGHANLL